ncbi:MAG: DNA primase [Acidimicrobiia bacterium]
MGILDDDVARVRDATDLVALASEHLALKRVGKNYRGLCPFHAEKTASFYVHPDVGRYRCYGCQASGDAISFVREVEHLDFVDAVERLAARAGITLRYDNATVTKDRGRRDRLVETVGAAIDFYEQLLLEAPDGGTARRYLRSRGFDGDAARRFRLGWSPDDFDRLSIHLQRKGFSRDDIVESGLAFVNRVNKLQDQFRARLMFPIFDTRGDAVGFGGRALGEEGPKYKNSADNTLYHKSRLLYGLNWAKGEIVARGDVIICEGYTDVMAFALADAPNAVATCGTALADDHFQILKNLARKVVLAYDSDAAGQGAAEKWYAWEQQFEIQVQVADLPPGRDPADVWHDDPEALLAAVASAKPFLEFRIDRALAAADRNSIEGRARAGELGAAIVAEHPSDLVRDQYVMKLAGELDIEADRLREAVATARRGRTAGKPAPDRAARGVPSTGRSPEESRRRAPEPKVDRRELDLLLYTVHDAELVDGWIDSRLFADPVARAAFEAIVSTPNVHEAIARTDGAVLALLERVAVEEPVDDDEPETLRARLMANAIAPAANRVLAAMLRASDERSSSLKLLLDSLAYARDAGDWEAVVGACEQLLGWIEEGSRGVGAA